MKPASFAYHRPRDIGEVLALLASHGDDAKILAGGQSLVPMMNLRVVSPAVLIDINRVPALSGVRTTDRGVTIGAMTRQKDVLGDALIRRDAPLVAEALGHVGHVQTRSRGTIGGSLAHADPAAELPLAMVALDAVFTVRNLRGSRDIRARDFFRDALTTALAADELLVEIRVPIAPPGTRVAFREYSRRQGDFAIAAAAVQRSGGDLRISAAVGGVAVVPRHCPGLAGLAASGTLDRRRLEEIANRTLDDFEPLSDHHASGEYRRRLGALALADCLVEVMQ
jgi:carbon-monoxide dehydrogenase medium subunit